MVGNSHPEGMEWTVWCVACNVCVAVFELLHSQDFIVCMLISDSTPVAVCTCY